MQDCFAIIFGRTRDPKSLLITVWACPVLGQGSDELLSASGPTWSWGLDAEEEALALRPFPKLARDLLSTWGHQGSERQECEEWRASHRFPTQAECWFWRSLPERPGQDQRRMGVWKPVPAGAEEAPLQPERLRRIIWDSTVWNKFTASLNIKGYVAIKYLISI